MERFAPVTKAASSEHAILNGSVFWVKFRAWSRSNQGRSRSDWPIRRHRQRTLPLLPSNCFAICLDVLTNFIEAIMIIRTVEVIGAGGFGLKRRTDIFPRFSAARQESFAN